MRTQEDRVGALGQTSERGRWCGEAGASSQSQDPCPGCLRGGTYLVGQPTPMPSAGGSSARAKARPLWVLRPVPGPRPLCSRADQRSPSPRGGAGGGASPGVGAGAGPVPGAGLGWAQAAGAHTPKARPRMTTLSSMASRKKRVISHRIWTQGGRTSAPRPAPPPGAQRPHRQAQAHLVSHRRRV